MKIKIYKENKPEKDNFDHLIKFPSETSVISLEETIQILFVLDKDIDDLKKILNVCRPWNYVRMVVYEGGLEENYLEHYEKIIKYQFIDEYHMLENYYLHYSNIILYIMPHFFKEPKLKRNKDIKLIEKNIPIGILPIFHFHRIDKKHIIGFLKIDIGDDKKVILKFRIKFSSRIDKGKYIYTFKTVEEALPEINKIIGKMGYV